MERAWGGADAAINGRMKAHPTLHHEPLSPAGKGLLIVSVAADCERMEAQDDYDIESGEIE